MNTPNISPAGRKVKRSHETIEQAIVRTMGPRIRTRQLTATDAADLFKELSGALYGLDVLRSAIVGQLDMDLPEILQMADDLTLDAANALDRALHYIASAVKVEVRS
jgi:hypothetical protein